MLKKILFIDDLRDPNLSAVMIDGVDEIIVARSSQEAIEVLTREYDAGTEFVAIYWDHDLGVVNGSVDDTRPVAKWLDRQVMSGSPVIIDLNVVHTSNSVAADWLMGTLSSYPLYYEVKRVNARLVSVVD